MGLFRNPNAVHGKLVKIGNENKKAVESDSYYALWVEDAWDDNERCLLFSQSDINKIKDVIYCDFIHQMDLGKLYRLGNAGSYFIKILDLEKAEKVVRLNSTVLNNGINRAEKQPEDVPKKGFIQDLLD